MTDADLKNLRLDMIATGGFEGIWVSQDSEGVKISAQLIIPGNLYRINLYYTELPTSDQVHKDAWDTYEQNTWGSFV